MCCNAENCCLVANPPFPNKFKPGDVAISKQEIKFCDGTKHGIGEEIIVTEKTIDYFNVWHKIYDLKR